MSEALPAAIVLELPAECPDRVAVLHLLENRRVDMQAVHHSGRLSIGVTASSPTAWAGHAQILAPDARESYRRNVSGESCAVVLDALAFGLGLAFPRRSGVPGPAPKLPPKKPPTDEPPRRKSDYFPPPPHRYAVEAMGGAWAGVAPNPGFAVAFQVALRSRFGPFFGRFSGGFVWAPPQTATSDLGSTRFGLAAATLELCPLGTGAPAAWSVYGCIRTAVGGHSSRGVNVADPQTTTMLWLSVEPRIWSEFWPWRRVAIQVAAGPMFPLQRNQFFVGTTPVFSIPTVAWTAEAGLSFVFFDRERR